MGTILLTLSFRCVGKACGMKKDFDEFRKHISSPSTAEKWAEREKEFIARHNYVVYGSDHQPEDHLDRRIMFLLSEYHDWLNR